MSTSVGISLNGVRVPLSRDRIAAVARSVLRAERTRDAMLSITFVSKATIRTMNRRHLGRSGVTDVISFGFRPVGRKSTIVGDIYISPEVARDAAIANSVSLREEIVRLVVHGMLHVLGHDHPEGKARLRSPMWRKQEWLVTRLASRSS